MTFHSEARLLEEKNPKPKNLPKGSVSLWQPQREEESRWLEPLGRWPWGSTLKDHTDGGGACDPRKEASVRPPLEQPLEWFYQ